MDNEIWKDVVGYEGIYQVSNLGNVKSLDRHYKQLNNNGKECNHFYKGRKLKQHLNNAGYLKVQLSYKYKSIPKRVHRLVAEAFIPNPNNYKCVNHIDGNKLNNNVDNLEWCTYSYNTKHAFKNGLRKPTWQNKTGKLNPLSFKVSQYDLNGNFIKEWDCLRDIQRELNVFAISVSRCCRGIQKTAGGYKWRYANDLF